MTTTKERKIGEKFQKNTKLSSHFITKKNFSTFFFLSFCYVKNFSLQFPLSSHQISFCENVYLKKKKGFLCLQMWKNEIKFRKKNVPPDSQVKCDWRFLNQHKHTKISLHLNFLEMFIHSFIICSIQKTHYSKFSSKKLEPSFAFVNSFLVWLCLWGFVA